MIGGLDDAPAMGDSGLLANILIQVRTVWFQGLMPVNSSILSINGASSVPRMGGPWARWVMMRS